MHALESGRERTTLTDSRIKLVLSDRLCQVTRRLDSQRNLEAGACKSHLTSLSDFGKSVPARRIQILPDELRYECHDTIM